MKTQIPEDHILRWDSFEGRRNSKGSEKFPAPGPSLCLLCFKICKLLRLVQRFGDQSQGVWDLMDTHGMSKKPMVKWCDIHYQLELITHINGGIH